MFKKYLKNTILLSSFQLIMTSFALAQSYNWPAKPFDKQEHSINGTFCENRPSGSVLRDHFHDGVDIGLVQGGEVYSVINGTVTGLTRTGGNAYIRVGRYAYVHVTPNPALDVGSNVVAYQTIIGTTNSQNHIHFKDGNPGSEINAIRNGGGITPLNDNFKPTISYIKFYLNKSTQQFTNNRVSGLVDIVSRAYDTTNDGYSGSNNGIYRMSYQIFDSSGQEPVTEKIQPYKFDNIPSSDSYIKNVYFDGSDLSTYIYNVTNKVNKDAYWDTRNFEKGFYRVKVEVEDTRQNITEKWSTVEIVAQDKTAPQTPELFALIGSDENDWTLNWYKNDSSDVEGYNLFFSYWGDSWNENPGISDDITAGDTSLTWEGFSNDVSIFFRLVAYDDGGPRNYSDSSDVYGIRLSDSGPHTLIVDGFERTNGYWQKTSHMFAMRYGLSLTAMEIPFNTSAADALEAGQVSLADYNAVNYMFGDAFENVLSTTEKQEIDNYLTGNGLFILSGNRLGQALNIGANADINFYQNILQASYVGLTAAKADSVYGVDGTILEGFSAAIKAPADTSMYLEIVDPNANSETVLVYNFVENKSAAILKQKGSGGTYTNSTLFYAGFPIELISEKSKRDELMFLLYQMAPTAIENETITKSPRTPNLYANYPNPFNPSTRIKYAIANAGFVKLTVFDRAGRVIRRLVDQNKMAGEHNIIWDGLDDYGNKVASGIYFYTLVSKNLSISRKMVLLK